MYFGINQSNCQTTITLDGANSINLLVTLNVRSTTIHYITEEFLMYTKVMNWSINSG